MSLPKKEGGKHKTPFRQLQWIFGTVCNLNCSWNHCECINCPSEFRGRKNRKPRTDRRDNRKSSQRNNKRTPWTSILKPQGVIKSYKTMVAWQDIENPRWMSSFQFAELVLCLLWPRHYHHFCTLQHFKWYYWSKSQSQCCISACHQWALELSDTLFFHRKLNVHL